jgi:hypothetical protein
MTKLIKNIGQLALAGAFMFTLSTASLAGPPPSEPEELTGIFQSITDCECTGDITEGENPECTCRILWQKVVFLGTPDGAAYDLIEKAFRIQASRRGYEDINLTGGWPKEGDLPYDPEYDPNMSGNPQISFSEPDFIFGDKSAAWAAIERYNRIMHSHSHNPEYQMPAPWSLPQ